PTRCPVPGNRASVPWVEPTDALLTARLAAGDERALAQAFDQLGSAVYGAALRVLGEWTAAQDIAQDVFVELWSHPDRYDPAAAHLPDGAGQAPGDRHGAQRAPPDRPAGAESPADASSGDRLPQRRGGGRGGRRRGPGGGAAPARQPARGRGARLLRRAELPRGRAGDRHPRGGGQVAAAAGAGQAGVRAGPAAAWAVTAAGPPQHGTPPPRLPERGGEAARPGGQGRPAGPA